MLLNNEDKILLILHEAPIYPVEHPVKRVPSTLA